MVGDVLNNDKGFETYAFSYFIKQMNIGPFGSDLTNDYFVLIEYPLTCRIHHSKHKHTKLFNLKY